MTPLTTTTKVMLIDANNLLIRAIHAAKAKMSDDNGYLTGALVIFINMLNKHIKIIDPDRLVLCFDSGPSEYRREIYPAYKAARDYNTAVSNIWELTSTFLDLAGLPSIKMEGVEADDLIAYYVRNKRLDDRVTIVSSDKDFMQLLEGWVQILQPTDSEPLTPFRFRSLYGCKPEQWAQVLAITGDVSDNIPGIPGFGVKTAIKYLNRYQGDMDKMLIDEPKFAFTRETVERNLKLIDLIHPMFEMDLPPVPDYKPTTREDEKWGELMAFLSAHQMVRIRQRYQKGELFIKE
jgi:DNA polymerase-1